MFGEGEQAAVDVEEGTIAPVVVWEDLQTEGATAAVGVFARAVNVIGIDGDGLEIEIVIQRGVMKIDEVGSEARTDDSQPLAGKIAEDEGSRRTGRSRWRTRGYRARTCGLWWWT